MSERKAPIGFIGQDSRGTRPLGTSGDPKKKARLKTNWQTPEVLLDCVRDYFGGEIPFDVCTSPDNPCGAVGFWTKGDDALSRPWPRRWWCNPPYGSALTKGGWLQKIAEEASTGSEGVILLSTARWEQYPMQCLLAEINNFCFIRKRVPFRNPETGDHVSGGTYANMFLGVGTETPLWEDAFSKAGLCLRVDEATYPPEKGLTYPKAKRRRK